MPSQNGSNESWWQEVRDIADRQSDPLSALNLKRALSEEAARMLLRETPTTESISEITLFAREITEPIDAAVPLVNGCFRLVLQAPPFDSDLPDLFYIREVDEDGELPEDGSPNDIFITGEPFEEDVFEDGIGGVTTDMVDQFGEIIGGMAVSTGVESRLPQSFRS